MRQKVQIVISNGYILSSTTFGPKHVAITFVENKSLFIINLDFVQNTSSRVLKALKTQTEGKQSPKIKEDFRKLGNGN